MIWLAWRQFRAQTLVAAGALAVFAAVFGCTASGLARLYDSSGAASCGTPTACAAATGTFLARMRTHSVYPALYFFGASGVILAPLLIGVFWGAPMVTRELEANTQRLVWYQSVTRARWAVAKLAVLGLASMAVAGLLSLVVTWWAGPIDSAGGFPIAAVQLSRVAPPIFDARGIAPLGDAAFGFVLGVTVGVFVRRTVPAMAVTLVVFAAVQLMVVNWVRPCLVPPDHLTSPALTASALDGMKLHNDGRLILSPDIPGAWIMSNETLTASGRVFVLPVVPQCQHGTHDECVSWLADQNLRQTVTYQPADRYWALQWRETALLLLAAVFLSAGCVLWLRHGRIS